MFMVGKKEVEIVDSEGNPAEFNLAKPLQYVHPPNTAPDNFYSERTERIHWEDPKPVKPARTIWVDKRTGERLSANQEFIEKLPYVLGVGEENIHGVREILEALGGSYADDPNGTRFNNDSRQLRDAKNYLVSERGVPIVSIQSPRGGYYYAAEPSALLKNAMAFREQAAGLISAAEALESVATRLDAESAHDTPNL